MTDLLPVIQPEACCDRDHRAVYRYRESTYVTNRGNSIVTKSEWVFVKKMSCKKMDLFHPLIDARETGVECVNIICDNPENGKLYKAIIANEYKDWETGHIEEYDWKMIPYEPESPNEI